MARFTPEEVLRRKRAGGRKGGLRWAEQVARDVEAGLPNALAEAGRKGGETTLAKHGRSHMVELRELQRQAKAGPGAELADEARRQRLAR